MNINGLTQWQFCEQWYTADCIATTIKRQNTHLVERHHRVPEDIYSPEFAEWLALQYRLAMNKGMDIARATLTRNEVPPCDA